MRHHLFDGGYLVGEGRASSTRVPLVHIRLVGELDQEACCHADPAQATAGRRRVRRHRHRAVDGKRYVHTRSRTRVDVAARGGTRARWRQREGACIRAREWSLASTREAPRSRGRISFVGVGPQMAGREGVEARQPDFGELQDDGNDCAARDPPRLRTAPAGSLPSTWRRRGRGSLKPRSPGAPRIVTLCRAPCRVLPSPTRCPSLHATGGLSTSEWHRVSRAVSRTTRRHAEARSA
jgi:hypothetical protein